MLNMKRQRKISPMLCLFQVLLVSCTSVISRTNSINISVQYPAGNSDPVIWRNLAIDPVSRRVYAGAVNRLFQFDENLAVIQSVQTGPVLDNPDCYNNLGNKSCLNADSISLPSSLLDNFNQVLVIDQKHQQLVTCGSVFQGTCQTRNLTDISLSTDYSWQLSQYVIVASRTYPTVAFVGQGPFGDDVLYVGTGYSGKIGTAWFLTKYLAGVSSRNLTGPGTFLVTEGNTYGTRATLFQDAAIKYRINYVAGFSLNGFSYFLTTQPEPFSLPIVSDFVTSKLVQVCQGDKYFDSYVETRIICTSGRVDYNLIQAAVFIQPGTNLAREFGLNVDDYVLVGIFTNSSPLNFGSAVCLYPLSDIRRTFTQNIQRCYNSSASQVPVGPQFIGTDRTCQMYQASINDSYCGSLFPTVTRITAPNSPLVGTIPLTTSRPALILSGVNVTAVNAATVGDHTVLFMGTSDGKLSKALLTSNTSDPYEKSEVGTSAVNQDLLFDVDKSHLYLMTSETIFKIPVSDCQQYATCDRCLASRDPYCGWCTLEKSCRKSSECPDTHLANRWLSIYSGRDQEQVACPSISVTPSYADINRDLSVAVEITSLPELKNDEFYVCVFGSRGSTSEGAVVGSQLTCPVTQNKPNVPSSDDNVTIVLSIRMSNSLTDFIHTNFTFYDCSHHAVCSSCLSSPWSCRWCIFTNKCQNETSSCLYSSSVLEKQSCPSLMSDADEILIPSGINRTITLMANNLPVPQANEKGYFCEISSAGKAKLTVPAERLNSSLIKCTSYSYHSTDTQPYFSTIRIVWGNGGFLIDGSCNATVFNCSAMADGDCNRCLSLQYQLSTAKYGCQWCASVCQPNVSQCASLSSDQTRCPRATVTSIFPQSGPIEGGTLVTITGTNLGYTFGKVAVYIGDVSCLGFSQEYIISQRYVCVTPSTSTAGSRSLRVFVSNESAFQDVRLESFVYKDPQVYRIRPAVGPKAGGTPVTLLGKDLETGSNTTIIIGQQPCIMDRLRSNDSQIRCITTESNNSNVITDVQVRIDGASRSLNKVFNYTENPTISVPIPNGSFKTGGCTVSIPTSNLDFVAEIGLELENDVIPVTFRNSSVFQFLSPMISAAVTSDITYQLRIKLDGIRIQKQFTIYPDPFVEPFEKGSRPYGGDTIQLSGRNMRTPCMDNYKSEVAIFVGTQTCNISSLDNVNLYCKPPNKAPDGETQARVTVTIGTSLRFDIGKLVYPNDQTSVFWPIIVGVIGGVLVVIIIVLLLIFCIISNKNERQYGKLQAQMEALESGVRNECKQAFTELQTDVSDFTSDISIIGIPFWDYRMYAFKLLFPMVLSHQVLYINTAQNGRSLGEFGEKMHRFNQLLGSKYFLLTFIRTLEKQPHEFGITDRSKVASLLSVVLIDKMEYATEIIKILLDDLIVKSIDKRAPKLMLRRAETVVEKLLANWLSLSMYGYLKTHAGRALFMLYKAVKLQTEKGPIDAVTAEARYSLSEDRLLREKLEAKTLNVKVYDADNIGQSPVACRMLDCDTITQAKEKALDAIYKNTPFSKRPSRNTIDLRWSAAKRLDGYPDPRDFLPLNDQDVTTKMVDGWKRVNTLSHYYVGDESVFQLQKNNKSEPVYQVHGMIELESGTLMKTIRLEECAKVWHLAKHDDVTNNVSRTQKVISEIFLTRLLQTKMTLQQYIDDLFTTILAVDSSLPPTIKYLYDFLDSAAQRHGISDHEVVHAWKSNSLPLRFWVNLIKNPEFVFDINKSPVVDCCLSVIAQTFMDSCSTHEHRLGKDSPSAKLLFAKDIPRYRQLVSRFYQGIKELPPVTDDAMASAMADLSVTYSAEFNQEVALHELYAYASRFRQELVMALENDPSAKKLRLAEHFEQLHLIKDENPMNSTA